MEDFLDSRAAVEAMAALQERMKELEQENDGLRKEVIKLRATVENSENELAEREKAMSRDAEKAQKMLESAAETLVELRRIRIENRKLESQIDGLEFGGRVADVGHYIGIGAVPVTVSVVVGLVVVQREDDLLVHLVVHVEYLSG